MDYTASTIVTETPAPSLPAAGASEVQNEHAELQRQYRHDS